MIIPAMNTANFALNFLFIHLAKNYWAPTLYQILLLANRDVAVDKPGQVSVLIKCTCFEMEVRQQIVKLNNPCNSCHEQIKQDNRIESDGGARDEEAGGLHIKWPRNTSVRTRPEREDGVCHRKIQRCSIPCRGGIRSKGPEVALSRHHTAVSTLCNGGKTTFLPLCYRINSFHFQGI